MNRPDIQTPRPRSRRREEAGSAPAAGNGWPSVKLDEVCVDSTGTRDPGAEPDKTFRYVDISSVDNRAKRITEAKTLPGKAAPSRARQIIRTNDVLVATTRPNLNAVARVPSELDGEICSTGFCVLRPTSQVDSEYLFMFVQSDAFARGLADLVKGALYPAVSDKQVRGRPIPLPPLAEQRRIAERLREQMAEVARARAAVRAQLAAAQALPAAVLRAHFTTPAALRWPRRRLDEVANVVNGYGFAERLQGHTGLAFPFIKVSDMNAEGAELVVSRAANTVDFAMLKELGARTYPAGTVIFPKVGGALLTNKKRVLGFEATFDNNVMGVVPREVDGGWLLRWVQTIDLRTLANTQALPSIRQSDVAALEIPLPPLPEQRALATRLTAELSAATTLRAALEARLAEIERLPAALLRTAFTPAP